MRAHRARTPLPEVVVTMPLLVPNNPPSPLRCKCESCRLTDAVFAAEPSITKGAAARIALTVYWSLFCGRCGERVPFAGLTEQTFCEGCEIETENGG